MREQNSATTMNRREMLKRSAIGALSGTSTIPGGTQAVQTVTYMYQSIGGADMLRQLDEMQSDRQRVVVRCRHGAVDLWLVGANGSPRKNPIDGPSVFKESVWCRDVRDRYLNRKFRLRD